MHTPPPTVVTRLPPPLGSSETFPCVNYISPVRSFSLLSLFLLGIGIVVGVRGLGSPRPCYLSARAQMPPPLYRSDSGLQLGRGGARGSAVHRVSVVGNYLGLSVAPPLRDGLWGSAAGRRHGCGVTQAYMGRGCFSCESFRCPHLDPAPPACGGLAAVDPVQLTLAPSPPGQPMPAGMRLTPHMY